MPAELPLLPILQAEVVKHFAGDRIAAIMAPDIRSLKPGEGGIVTHKGQRVMAYHDEATGRFSACKPTCKHLGCYTMFNAAEK